MALQLKYCVEMFLVMTLALINFTLIAELMANIMQFTITCKNRKSQNHDIFRRKQSGTLWLKFKFSFDVNKSVLKEIFQEKPEHIATELTFAQQACSFHLEESSARLCIFRLISSLLLNYKFFLRESNYI